MTTIRKTSHDIVDFIKDSDTHRQTTTCTQISFGDDIMTRVALYARYSSDNQREASITDQLKLCRVYAERQGWTTADTYQDRAVSGASLVRSGIQALLADALRGRFDVVLAEALDRISRDQEDVAGAFKRLTFAGVKIITLSEGEITHLHVGLKGTMNALFLKDLADKTRRGLRGRVEAGKSGGGLCYGYAVVKQTDAAGEPICGGRRIVSEEADVVRRIFREFAAGTSPRRLAVTLNSEGIHGPLGRAWGDTTIRGHVSRGTGILNNELYAGRLVWNRQRYIKDPSSGKRVSRLNPATEWITTDVPALRIVDDALWQAVRARQTELASIFAATTNGVREARAKRFHATRRPAFLLSGLLTCGTCNGRYGVMMQDRYGCLNHFRRASCSNNRTIRRSVIEQRVLAGLTEKLVSADAVAEAVRAYHIEMNRQNQDRRAQSATDRQALGKIERAIAGIIAAIEDGLYQPAMKARMAELEQQKSDITARLASDAPPLPDVNPNIADIYRRKVVHLTDALNDPQTNQEASMALRSLIGDIVLTPGAKRGEVHAMLRGALMNILDFAAEKNAPGTALAQVTTNAVASPRNHITIENSNYFNILMQQVS
jgi:site-specific DNA recombinase